MVEMSVSEFEQFQNLTYNRLGIRLPLEKKQMTQSRLQKVIRLLDISTFTELYQLLIQNDKNAWAYFCHEITTHKTDFFREPGHFDYIRNEISFILAHNPRIQQNKEIRVWSAGCSTGEEAYTIGMILREVLPENIRIRILATDISNQVISIAIQGIYLPNEGEIPDYYLKKYFKNGRRGFEVVQEIRDMVTFRTFNLMDNFPFKNKFDIVFCRNVMIYFDTQVQESLIEKFYHVLVSGGLFFIGHSESLANKNYKFKYVKPTIYIRSN